MIEFANAPKINFVLTEKNDLVNIQQDWKDVEIHVSYRSLLELINQLSELKKLQLKQLL